MSENLNVRKIIVVENKYMLILWKLRKYKPYENNNLKKGRNQTFLRLPQDA